MRRLVNAGLLVAMTLPLWASAPAKCTLEGMFSRVPPVSARTDAEVGYRFTVDYINLDASGTAMTTQRVIATYTMKPASGSMSWDRVTVGSVPPPGTPDVVASGEHQRYMEGMHYDRSAKPFAAEFFGGFPQTAVQEKNLVWDTWMFDQFIVATFDKLRPNTATSFTSGDVSLGGAGSFHNHNVELTWVGLSRRNGRDCALVQYEAFLNTFTTGVPGFTVTGQSEYWGEMWVALDSRTLEYATLREEVVGTLARDQSEARPIHVLRVGQVERTR